MSTEPRPLVFISYSRKDLAFAERLMAALKAHHVRAYLDQHNIAPGEPWKDRLAALIAGDALLTSHPPPNDWARDPIFNLAYRWAAETSLRKLEAA